MFSYSTVEARETVLEGDHVTRRHGWEIGEQEGGRS